jgi:hypothetical protein
MRARRLFLAFALATPAIAFAESPDEINAAIDAASSKIDAYVTKGLRAKIVSDRPAEINCPLGICDAGSILKNSISISLESFPTIHISVDPIPPRDFKVSINGEDCPATEAGLYKVPVGSAQVSVVRSGKTPCTWSGSMARGQTQLVSCHF